MLATAVKGSKALPVSGVICVLAPKLQQGVNERQSKFWKEASELSPLISFFLLTSVWACLPPTSLFDSFPRSLLKCSLELALSVFHRQISACVILNPEHSISSSLPARATRIQLEEPHVVILIFQDWPTFYQPLYCCFPGGLNSSGGQWFLRVLLTWRL